MRGAWSVECRACSVECVVWNMQCVVRSVECGECSVQSVGRKGDLLLLEGEERVGLGHEVVAQVLLPAQRHQLFDAVAAARDGDLVADAVRVLGRRGDQLQLRRRPVVLLCQIERGSACERGKECVCEREIQCV